VKDLVMGSYGYGSGAMEQVGAVFVWPGGQLPKMDTTILDDASSQK
jgi:hypothetical protein